MQTTRLPGGNALATILFAISFGVAACSSGGAGAAGTPAASASATSASAAASTSSGILVTVEVRGGACVGVPCDTTIYLDRDGRVHQAAKPPNDLGFVPAVALAALDAAISSTDFAALRSHPFTGQCPTASDGQEHVFDFASPGGVQRIATCETAVDLGSPLFVALSTALGPFVSLPTP